MIEWLENAKIPEDCTKDVVVDFWKDLGFLYGLEENMKEECAECYNQMALYILKNDLHVGELEDVIFPTIRYTIESLGGFNGYFDSSFFIDFLRKSYSKAKERADKKEYMGEVFRQNEIAKILSEMLADEIKKNDSLTDKTSKGTCDMLKNNRFLCKVKLDDFELEYCLVKELSETITNCLFISFMLDETRVKCITRLNELETISKKGGIVNGSVELTILSSDGTALYTTRYTIDKIERLIYPNYSYEDSNSSVFHLMLHYTEKENFDDVYVCDKPKDDGVFGHFDTFGDAESFFNRLLVDGEYEHVLSYNKVDEDIEKHKRPTIVVGSRQCGMTTHMLAWSLAKISTEKDKTIWYITNSDKSAYQLKKKVKQCMKAHTDWLSYENNTIRNEYLNSKICFISIRQDKILSGKEIPSYVIYDSMAFMDRAKLSNFIEDLDVLETAQGKSVKEICVSVPSYNGSLFNFLALIAENPINIPWHERYYSRKNNIGKDKFVGELAEDLYNALGEDKFAVEMQCKIGLDDNERWREIDDNKISNTKFF